MPLEKHDALEKKMCYIYNITEIAKGRGRRDLLKWRIYENI